MPHTSCLVPRSEMKYPFIKHFLVCTGGRCNNPDRGEERGELIRDELKALNKARARKGAVRVCSVSCLDLCDHGPNMIVDGDVYSHLTRELAKAVYAGVMGDGPRRDDLQLREDEFLGGNSAAVKSFRPK
jgi:(2Fe-2S) ferredoxin